MSYGKAEELPKWALQSYSFHRPQSTDMAHLTKPVKYDIKDSNIALLGSDVRVST